MKLTKTFAGRYEVTGVVDDPDVTIVVLNIEGEWAVKRSRWIGNDLHTEYVIDGAATRADALEIAAEYGWKR